MSGHSMVEARHKGLIRCGWQVFAPEESCPPECPYLSEDISNPCHFQCVAPENCGVLDPSAKIPDEDQLRCRRCRVAGCAQCVTGPLDKCHKCEMGYFVDPAGKCTTGGWYIWAGMKIAVFCLLAVIVLWYIELRCRRPINKQGYMEGLKFRKSTRVHMPRNTHAKVGVVDPLDDTGLLYPLSTNTMVTPAGGPGTMLHFSYQAFIIIWSLCMCGLYGLFARTFGYDLLRVGTLPAQTPQELCSVIRWGARIQDDLMYQKVKFIVLAYFMTTAMSIACCKYHQWRFKRVDRYTISSQDYAALVTGLPKRKGTEEVETEFSEWLEKETGQKVVGVSIAWNYISRADEVEVIIQNLVSEDDKAHQILKNGPPKEKTPEEEEDEEIPEEPEAGKISKFFYNIDDMYLGATGYVEVPDDPPDGNAVKELLESLETSDAAFVIFESQDSRDKAVRKFRDRGGVKYPEEAKRTVRLHCKAVEPGTILWPSFSHGSKIRRRTVKLFLGSLAILLSLALWCVVFYLPYAYFVSAFSYADGEQPSFVAGMAFTILVVIGNQIMYFLCDSITHWAGFPFEDDRMCWYCGMYLSAIMLNTVCDLLITGFISYRYMVGMGVHTADGKLLESLNDLNDIIEAYPMQKAMGKMLYAYCFPSCFMFPFIIEVGATILLIEHLTKHIVRSRAELRGRKAELAMQYFMPMDLGRYSDVVLNAMLATTVLFVPGGYALQMFLALTLSHSLIYFMDHWRVIRRIPNFIFSQDSVDVFAHYAFAIVPAIMISCAVFKGYPYLWPSLHGGALACCMFWPFVIHLAVHWKVIAIITKKAESRPKFKWTDDDEPDEMVWAEYAQWEPVTYFSTNPIHCLRSKYFHRHEPAQVFYVVGKEYLQRANPDIGTYYEDKKRQEPDIATTEQVEAFFDKAEEDET